MELVPKETQNLNTLTCLIWYALASECQITHHACRYARRHT